MKPKIIILLLLSTSLCGEEFITKEKVVGILNSIPSWMSLSKEDKKGRQSVLQMCKQISVVDAALMREAIASYCAQEAAKDEGSKLNAWSKIYVLNRYFFNVPDKEDKNKHKFFGGFGGVPINGETVNVLWPISIDEKGNLVLSGIMTEYMGPEYRAVEEFDYFLSKYERRIPLAESYLIEQPLESKGDGDKKKGDKK